jgi:hypothetical protein
MGALDYRAQAFMSTSRLLQVAGQRRSFPKKFVSTGQLSSTMKHSESTTAAIYMHVLWYRFPVHSILRACTHEPADFHNN